MGSTSGLVLNSRFPAVKRIDVEKLRGFAALLSSEDRISFSGAYGNLLRLLQLDSQEGAIMALSRFCNPEIRCFLFSDFQLSPTLEEYDQILGFARSGLPPYQHQKHRYTDQEFSQFLQVSVKELVRVKKRRTAFRVFPSDTLKVC